MADNNATLRKIVLPERGIESLFGPYDENLKTLETLLGVTVTVRGNDIVIEGDQEGVDAVERIVEDYTQLIRDGQKISSAELKSAFKQIAEDRAYSLQEHMTSARFNPSGKKQVTARSANQRRYLEMIEQNDVVFGIGPAGTGKTYLAVAMAVHALFQKKVNRIVLTRPAVEAGEKLGFLPGDLQDKIDPYLRPLYDALFDLVDYEKVAKMLEKRVIEIAPLAFMRGRTLADAFIILDEAQNTTTEQMKMFLTRIGLGSQAVITGDLTQIDLPAGRRSGLIEAERIMRGIDGIGFVTFTDRDVVRHRLVQMIIRAYEEHAKKGLEAAP
jgi:phosphate starvation-inducible PhoH-like protein